MAENEIIVLAGSDLFRMGMTVGIGITVGVCFSIGIYGLASKALDLLVKSLAKATGL